MEIEEATEKRRIFEREIKEFLDDKLLSFYNETSLIPSDVDITLTKVYIVGYSTPRCAIVEKVDVKVQI